MTEHHTYHRETLAGAWRDLSHAVGTAAGRLREQRRRAQARRALMACSDRTPADIGIPRGLAASIRRWRHSRREGRRV